jgi:replicative DNA helicase
MYAPIFISTARYMADQTINWASLQTPYSQEAEEATIGAILVNPVAFFGVAAFLKADDFFILRHRYIWQALERLHERNEPIDYLTLKEELEDMGRLGELGGPAYLTQLINNTPTSVHAEVYGRLVERAATRRRLMSAADQIKSLALDEEMTVEQVISESEAKLFDVTERQLTRELMPMREAVSQYFDRIEYLMQNKGAAFGVPTGFKDLDKLLGGLQKSDLIIFAGRPGMGKSSFLFSTAINMARLGARIAIFSLEMGVEQIVQRLISMEAGINSQNLRLGQLNQQEWARFVHAAGNLSNFRIFIDDTAAMNPLELRTKSFRLAREHGLDLIVVDYLQLMNSGGAYENNRVQEVSFISRNLKELARELNVPVLSAAQLSRAVEQRQDKRPQLSDLRESGCLASESLVYLPDIGQHVPIRDLCGKSGFEVLTVNPETWKLERGVVTNSWCTGSKPVYRLTTQLGRSIRATANHKFLTICGWKRLDELTSDDHIALPRRLEGPTTQTMSDAELAWDRALKLSRAVKSQPIADLAGSDVYWDTLAAIEPDGETEVFDLTVPNNSNFVANGTFVHNSLEQDSDIVMFLYRDEMYNEATEFPNQAEIIVAKHRNGPTGTINLYFEKTLTKFMNAAERSVDLSHI